MFVHNAIVEKSTPEVLTNIVTPELNHFITLRLNDVGICITGTYRRPAGNKTNFIKELDEYCLSRKNNVISGDFNFDVLDTNDTDACEYRDSIAMRGFTLLNKIDVCSATRLVSRKILDHVITNKLHKDFKMALRHSSRSDHCMVVLSIKGCRLTHSNDVKKTKVNFTMARQKLQATSHATEDGGQLNEMIANSIRESTTVMSVRANHRIRKPYITCEILELIRERNILCATSRK